MLFPQNVLTTLLKCYQTFPVDSRSCIASQKCTNKQYKNAPLRLSNSSDTPPHQDCFFFFPHQPQLCGFLLRVPSYLSLMFLAFFSRCLCFQVTVMEKDHQNICLLIQLLWNCLLHHSLQSLLRECLHSPYFPICQFALLKTCLRKLDELLFIGSISKELILLRSNFYRNIMNVDIKCHYSLCRPVRMLSVFC